MLVESLVFSRFTYALPVWGPAISQESLSRINRLHNRGVRITCGLRKSEHVSNHRRTIGWLSPQVLIQHRTLGAMLDQYINRGIPLTPRIKFGRHHAYNTRCPIHFAEIARCRLALSKRHFCNRATTWWNLLPHKLFSDLPSFRNNLYKYLISIL